ncbi:sensor histidine kinase [Clostridium omnivorum]|uniref:histidine kinase n=1 Tax=Clostridium omnivorum TaxID=1604902 RepID=A0ABQ5N8E8_9CLOT|nr:Spo0B domain-containing protein [Clostridium sp. E14]GLC31513.1 signal transduction histidine kinase [Clostridium sp. E14]
MKNKLNVNKTIVTVIILNAFQIAVIIGAVIYKYFMKKSVKIDSFDSLLIITVILILINSFLTIKDIHLLGEQSSQYDFIKDTLEKVEDLNRVLRAQRHDFMNHLQVVHGLMEMDEYDDAKDYIEKVFNDIQKVNKILKTSNPAVNALLEAKVIYSEKRGIKTHVNVNSQLKNIKMPGWELCRVLGNLIDNAIYAIQQNGEQGCITIDIFEDLKQYGFKIKDNGPQIQQDIIDKIFEVGFTTKGEKGEGMGLAITKEILNKYGGDIIVTSDKDKTEFEGWIPK